MLTNEMISNAEELISKIDTRLNAYKDDCFKAIYFAQFNKIRSQVRLAIMKDSVDVMKIAMANLRRFAMLHGCFNI